MKTRIATENAQAEQLIPPTAPDNSGIGVNYADAYLKPLNVQLEGGPKIACKRKGLKVVLSIGDRTGEAVMRRVEHGPDVRQILRRALETAAVEAGSQFTVEHHEIYLEI
jgi:hypothetical protein